MANIVIIITDCPGVSVSSCHFPKSAAAAADPDIMSVSVTTVPSLCTLLECSFQHNVHKKYGNANHTYCIHFQLIGTVYISTV